MSTRKQPAAKVAKGRISNATLPKTPPELPVARRSYRFTLSAFEDVQFTVEVGSALNGMAQGVHFTTDSSALMALTIGESERTDLAHPLRTLLELANAVGEHLHSEILLACQEAH
jgi:hypothetical protein